MKVKFMADWGDFKEGQVVDVPEEEAEDLHQAGRAYPVGYSHGVETELPVDPRRPFLEMAHGVEKKKSKRDEAKVK